MTTDASTQHPRGRRHLVRWAVIGVIAVVVVAVGVIGGTYLLRDHPDPKSVDRAVEDYRRSSSSTTRSTSSVRLPAAGVYEMQGTGEEKISFPPNSQVDGTTMPVSVEHLAGNCFRWRVDYNEAHWQEQQMCSDGADLLLGSFRNFQRWDFGSIKVENTSGFTCDPPQRYPIGSPTGTVTTGSCTGTNTAVEGPTVITSRIEVIGRKRLRIGNSQVDTAHLRQSDRATGAQSGQETIDWWFDVRTGLPVRVERSYRLDSSSPVGTVTYTEAGQGQLTSVEPRQ